MVNTTSQSVIDTSPLINITDKLATSNRLKTLPFFNQEYLQINAVDENRLENQWVSTDYLVTVTEFEVEIIWLDLEWKLRSSLKTAS